MSNSRPIETAEDAARYLEGLINLEKQSTLPYTRLGLEAIQGLLDRLGNPQRGFPALHIAGSKGKGSTALFSEALLLGAGVRVGTFTSPHLEDWTERFRVDGAPVRPADLAVAVDRLRPHIDELRRSDSSAVPSFFDATTAAAWLIFREAGVDCAVMEVGLGGRLDSTNELDSVVTCVTQIELEHTDKLGDTLAAIAGEKAGILKPGVPAVMGPLHPSAAEVVRSRADELGAPLAELGRDFRVTHALDHWGRRIRIDDSPQQVEAVLPVLGAHQAENAALAFACVRRSHLVVESVLAESAVSALETVVLPGRVERLSGSPWVLVDSAHTRASARELAAVLRSLPREHEHHVRFVLSLSADKDIDAVVSELMPHASAVTVTLAESTRSLPVDAMASRVRSHAPNIPISIVRDPRTAVHEAIQGLGSSDCLCITGSVYLAGIARSVWREANPAEYEAGAPDGRGSRSSGE
ncbi:bifunctional folylpolyglutamate synthase/dihydrofolate synthase [Myxococcota bacterium]|nr:bifunctional folylpolyglutamate synthase/dihydrofolate synthase [Myxococcota bacterium]